MCGISCYIGYDNAFDFVYFGLEMLQNRGYDSAGICSIFNNNFLIEKKASSDNINSLEYLKSKSNIFNDSTVMIGHTRWATHGPKTDNNSHPHIDFSGKFALVHNGIIENYAQLKNELINKHNIKFNSQTDTEVIVNLLGVNYKILNNVYNAITKTIESLEGTWGLAIICLDDPDTMYCTRHGSPLLVGFEDNFAMISSEQSGFCKFIKNYVCLPDNDILCLKKDNDKIDLSKINNYNIKKVNVDITATSPSPYPHWTIKEINEQVDACLRSLGMGGRLKNEKEVQLGGLTKYTNELLKLDNLILLGCGTSYNSGLYAIDIYKKISGFNVIEIMDGAEFTYDDIPKFGKTGLLLVSQSGETKDLHNAIITGKEHNLFMIGVVNVVESMIAREVDCGVYLNAGREVAVASTKAFTTQVIVLTLISIWFSQHRNIHDNIRQKIIMDIHKLPICIKNTIELIDSECDQVASYLKKCNSLFILGKGSSYAIAKEGSLKIKEIGYIHAEGYNSSALKHGPYSLIEEGTPIILITPDDEHFARNDGIAEEVKSRGAFLIGISDKILDSKYDIAIRLPINKFFQSLLAIIPMQLIAYKLSVTKGINPDMPRNLAKTVTVY